VTLLFMARWEEAEHGLTFVFTSGSQGARSGAQGAHSNPLGSSPPPPHRVAHRVFWVPSHPLEPP
jgi:hypothetical protein